GGADLAADDLAALVLAFPVVQVLLGTGCTCRAACSRHEIERPLFVGRRQHFFERGDALPDLAQARLAKIADAFAPGLCGDVHRVAAGHDDARDLLADRHDLVDAHPALVAAALAALAADRP